MNVTQKIVGLDGKLMTADGGNLMMRTVLVRALATTLEGDTAQPVEVLVKRYALAQRVQSDDQVTLTPEEVVELRARVAKVWALEVAGYVLKLLG